MSAEADEFALKNEQIRRDVGDALGALDDLGNEAEQNRESTAFTHYVIGGWYLTVLDVNGLPTFRVMDDDRPAAHVVRIALGREDTAALRRIADEADRLLDAKGVERTDEPGLSVLAEELEESQAGLHELNEAMRIADHWRHRNEDAEAVLRHVSNGRELFLALVHAAATVAKGVKR